jgi:hypothetical protein
MPLEISFKFRAKAIVPTSDGSVQHEFYFSCCARDEALTVSGSHFYYSRLNSKHMVFYRFFV